MIQDSFKASGLTNNSDQSDHQILDFKEGKCFAGNLDDFSKVMQDCIADATDQFTVTNEIANEDEVPSEESVNDDLESVNDDFIVDVTGHDHGY